MAQQQAIWTVRSVLDWSKTFFEKHGIDTPLLDAQLLLGRVLNMSKMQLFLSADRPMDASELAQYKSWILRRAKEREPIAYILGEQSFWSLDLKVTSDVLIPRADTECLVEKALDYARAKLDRKMPTWLCASKAISYEKIDDRKSYEDDEMEADEGAEKIAGNGGDDAQTLSKTPDAPTQDERAIDIVDVGTGSGAIILALASELVGANCHFTAIDISPAALEVAKFNAQQVTCPVAFLEGDLLDALEAKVDIIVSNPPYITSDEMKSLQPEVLKEPNLALEAGRDGLDVYRRLIPQAAQRLRDHGALLVEIGYRQSEVVESLFRAHGFTHVQTFKDYGKRPRVVFGLLENAMEL